MRQCWANERLVDGDKMNRMAVNVWQGDAAVPDMRLDRNGRFAFGG